ncbi:N-methyl-L-tryptophan oxidase [Phytoactinopolyspora alkaliphila]|uniref:N-methyl-L-tryptophan oxidase n=1 Tax=Phytoactinopolyspora alkaliphila TaxID=1783498 RepID=A0A6N9YMJ9_9ACTN|nr:N-methyl-L-tryptophan oxidase [Phytoactinopolyspora alkaliphila]
MRSSYRHIVIGAGALGTATAYHLARRGVSDVVVLEQYPLGHTFGASEDHSRIIRHAYHSPVYTALTPAAYKAWEHIEDETGVDLVHRTGGLDLAIAGTPGEAELATYRQALDARSIRYEMVDVAEIRARWPQWRIGEDTVGMYQADGGILDIGRATAAQIALARAHGVTFLPETPVLGIASHTDHVTIQTSQGPFRADGATLCVASWTPGFCSNLGLDWRLTLSQEQVSYFATPNLRDFAPERFPIWIWHGDSFFYGFPVYGEVGVKAARDMRGHPVTQETRSFVPDPQEAAIVAEFLDHRLPGVVGPELTSKTCIYDMPPDRDFILDFVPGHPRLTVGVGAGHAAKFAALIGEILADLATIGTTQHPIDAFRADRPALTDPAFEPTFRLG